MCVVHFQPCSVLPARSAREDNEIMKVMPSFLVDKDVMSMHARVPKRELKKDARIAAEGKKE